MSGEFHGKVAVVTGAAQGIGLSIARELAERGATVVVSDVNREAAEAGASGLNRAEAIACDVRDEEQVAELISEVVNRHDALDVVVINAGIASVKPLIETSLAEWREVMAVDLDGAFLTATVAGAEMSRRGSGAIVSVASVTALAGAMGIGHYAAAKAGVVSLTKTLASELRPLASGPTRFAPGLPIPLSCATSKPTSRPCCQRT